MSRAQIVRIGCRAAVSTLAALVAMLAVGCGRAHDGATSFAWSGAVDSGATVKVRNGSGDVRIARATGRTLLVNATRRSGGRSAPLRLLAERSGRDVEICVVSGSRVRHCGDRARGAGNILQRIFRRAAPTQMEIVVALPAGVRLDALTVNGGLTVADVAGDVRAVSTNGSVTVAALGGPVRAESVNGSVTARLDSLLPGAEIALKSVNGRVTAVVPASIDAAVDLASTNGRVTSAFDIAATSGRSRHLRGTLGAGGRPLALRSVNGDVRLDQLP